MNVGVGRPGPPTQPVLGHLGETLVQPGGLAAAEIPVDGVLELVSKNGEVDLIAYTTAPGVYVDHLSLIAVLVHLHRIFVGGTVVAGQALAWCVEDG